jgi:hypothetical protein
VKAARGDELDEYGRGEDEGDVEDDLLRLDERVSHFLTIAGIMSPVFFASLSKGKLTAHTPGRTGPA